MAKRIVNQIRITLQSADITKYGMVSDTKEMDEQGVIDLVTRMFKSLMEEHRGKS